MVSRTTIVGVEIREGEEPIKMAVPVTNIEVMVI